MHHVFGFPFQEFLDQPLVAAAVTLVLRFACPLLHATEEPAAVAVQHQERPAAFLLVGLSPDGQYGMAVAGEEDVVTFAVDTGNLVVVVLSDDGFGVFDAEGSAQRSLL